MSFEQSLTAFALESSGPAARALGVSLTLTWAALPDNELFDALPAAGLRAAVETEPPPSITLTF